MSEEQATYQAGDAPAGEEAVDGVEQLSLLQRVVNTGMGRIAAKRLLEQLKGDELNALENSGEQFYSILNICRQAVAKRNLGAQLKG